MVKNQPASEGDTGDIGLIPQLGRSPGEGNGNPHQYSCLENSMDRGGWWATDHGVMSDKKSDTTEATYLKDSLVPNNLKIRFVLLNIIFLRIHFYFIKV